MKNKTFGVVVSIIIALALAMFAGLYMLGLEGRSNNAFDDGYDYDSTTIYPYDEEGTEYSDDFADYEYYEGDEYYYEDDDSFYGEADFYFDEDGNTYDFDNYEFDELNDDSNITE